MTSSSAAGLRSASVLARALRLDRVELVLEEVAVDAEHDLAEHLDEAAVGVLGEALVAGQRGEALQRLVR